MIPPTVQFDETKLNQIIRYCPPQSNLDTLLYRRSKAEKLVADIRLVNSVIDEMLQETEYDASNIYITFETEAMQRVVLEAMQMPAHLVDEAMKFEGQVLHVKEPDEPSAVRWGDLHVSSCVSLSCIDEIYSRCLICYCDGD